MFERVFSHYFSINIESEEIEHNENSEFLDNLNIFVKEKLFNLYYAESNRQYKVKDSTTQVINNIKSMLNASDIYERVVYANSIAGRLLSKEKEVQDRIARLNQDVQKGGLILTSFKNGDDQYFVITKIHYIDFYEEDTFEENRGLPKKDVILKTSICKIINNNIQDDFYLSDSTKPKGEGTAKFWWDDFLELAPLINDTDNTRNVYEKVDELLKKEFHKDNREDYWFFRNNLVSYLQTEEYFVFDQMIDRTLGNMDIELLKDKNENEKNEFKESLKSQIQSVRVKDGKRIFDSEFTIDKKAVKAKIRRKISLLDNVELNIKGELEDFKQTIVADKEGNRKYIKIYSDSGYDAFKSQ